MAQKITIFVALLLVTPGLFVVYGVTTDGHEQNFIDREQSCHVCTAPKSHVVVALLDTGISPYHVVFRRPNMTQHPSAYIGGFPKNALSLNLTFGRDYESDVTKDKNVWEKVKDRTLYWIPGTNVLAISFGKFTKEGQYILDQQGHGTGTASVVAQENPDALILMIQTSDENLTEALSWAVNQSWIDIISSQFFYKRSVTGSYPAWEDYPEIAKRGVENGKIIINGAGNRRLPPWYSNVAGPPWIINVGGAENYSHGIDLKAACCTDYVSSFTRFIANCKNTTHYWIGGGTSLSAPSVAGVFSSILLKLRREYNYSHGIINNSLVYIPEEGIEITNHDIRNAVNHTAVYWHTFQWRPWKSLWWQLEVPWNPGYNPGPILEFLVNVIAGFLMKEIVSSNIPVNPVAPWLQMGWGFVNESIVDESVDVLLGKKEMPEKPEGAIRYMENIYHIRQKIWGT